MKRRIALPLVAVLSALALAAAFVLRPLPTSITRENTARIVPGMTHAQVVEILGAPRHEVPMPRPTPLGSILLITEEPRNDGLRYNFVLRSRWASEDAVVTVLCSEPLQWERGRVISVDVSKHQFPTFSAYFHWRVRRVLGLAPDVPTQPDSWATVMPEK